MLIAGYGYCAAAICRALPDSVQPVWATSRTPDGISIRDDVRIIPFAEMPEYIAQCTHLLVTTPPGACGDPVLQAFQPAIRQSTTLRWVGYLSTTGVYGDRQGGWVDEAATLSPTTQRSQRRVAAEVAWQSVPTSSPVARVIFRLAGIYGPNRNILSRSQDGEFVAIDKPGHVFSRIHVDDIAATVCHSLAFGPGEYVVNVADDLPASQLEVMHYVAKQLQRPAPKKVAFDAAELSPMARAFYQQCRRVDNRRLTQEWGLQLRYPTYREGYLALTQAVASSLSP